jgi:hypothetical protein
VTFGVAAGPTEQVNEPLSLHVVKTRTTAAKGTPILSGRIQCDADRNLYFATDVGERKTIVVKLNNRELTTTAFGENEPELVGFDAEAQTFAVSPDGDVHFVTWQVGKGRVFPYIAQFARDGKLKSKLKINDYFVFFQLGVFKTGEYLVGGFRPGKTESDEHLYFTAIVDKNGNVGKPIAFDNDLATNSRDPEKLSSYVLRRNNHAIELGAMASGDDGNIYILRRTSPALVFVVSPSGEIVRRLEIQPPVEFAMPTGIQVIKGLLAIRFSTATEYQPDPVSMLITADATTGETRQVFKTIKGMGSGMACFESPSIFSFATVGEGGKLKLTTYEPE